jgi:hypothetical protein
MKYEYGDKVTVVNVPECEILGKVGKIRGIAAEFPNTIWRNGELLDTNHYIIQFDVPLKNGFDSIQITAVCLELVKKKPAIWKSVKKTLKIQNPELWKAVKIKLKNVIDDYEQFGGVMNATELSEAFDWEATPQGRKYWDNLDNIINTYKG